VPTRRGHSDVAPDVDHDRTEPRCPTRSARLLRRTPGRAFRSVEDLPSRGRPRLPRSREPDPVASTTVSGHGAGHVPPTAGCRRPTSPNGTSRPRAAACGGARPAALSASASACRSPTVRLGRSLPTRGARTARLRGRRRPASAAAATGASQRDGRTPRGRRTGPRPWSARRPTCGWGGAAGADGPIRPNSLRSRGPAVAEAPGARSPRREAGACSSASECPNSCRPPHDAPPDRQRTGGPSEGAGLGRSRTSTARSRERWPAADPLTRWCAVRAAPAWRAASVLRPVARDHRHRRRAGAPDPVRPRRPRCAAVPGDFDADRKSPAPPRPPSPEAPVHAFPAARGHGRRRRSAATRCRPGPSAIVGLAPRRASDTLRDPAERRSGPTCRPAGRTSDKLARRARDVPG
jgi:hypothetical protein